MLHVGRYYKILGLGNANNYIINAAAVLFRVMSLYCFFELSIYIVSYGHGNRLLDIYNIIRLIYTFNTL